MNRLRILSHSSFLLTAAGAVAVPFTFWGGMGLMVIGVLLMLLLVWLCG